MTRLRTTSGTIVLSLLLLAGGCRTDSRSVVAPDWPPLESSELGTMTNVSVSDGFWLGGTPTADDLDLAKRRGIERVIDVCVADEHPEVALRAVCRRLGLDLVELGVRTDDEIPHVAVDKVVELLGEEERTKTLMFCRDGARSAILFAVHRVVNEGMSVEEALEEAKRSGIRPADAEAFVRGEVEGYRLEAQ